MLERCRIELIQGPPNSGRAGEILARFRAALDAPSRCSSSRPPTTSPPSSATSARGRAPRSAARSRPSPGSPARSRARSRSSSARRSSPTQRQALVRAAIVAPRRGACAARPPARASRPPLDALIAELQAALVAPAEFAATVAALDDPGYEAELAAIYARLRRAARRRADAPTAATDRRRGDRGAARAIPTAGASGRCSSTASTTSPATRPSCSAALAADGAASRSPSPTPTRRALAARAGLLTRLDRRARRRAPRAAAVRPRLHGQRHPAPPRPQPVRARRRRGRSRRRAASCSTRPGARGEAEAIGIEIARLLGGGHEPDEIAIVAPPPGLRRAGARQRARATLGDPGRARGVGCRSRRPRRHLAGRALPRGRRRRRRRRPAHPPAHRSVAATRRGRLGRAHASAAARRPPSARRPRAGRARRATSRACATPPTAAERLRALARSARELAEGAHRERGPAGAQCAALGRRRAVLGPRAARRGRRRGAARASSPASASSPAAEPPDLADAIEALESAHGAALARARRRAACGS